MECYKEEMFGPVLLCIKVDSLEEAITIVNRHKYGNGATIFTTSGVAARKFQNDVEAGLVGINVPVPIPLPFSSFNGSKSSFAGDLNFCAKAGVQFYTQIKTVAQQWEDLPRRLPLPLPPTSETETSSRGVSLSQPLTSESDLPSREVSPAMPSTSERDIASRNMSLSLPQTSDADLQNPKIVQSIEIDEELREHGGSRIVPSTSERDSMNANDRNSERMYIPQASKWDETLPMTSQRTETLLSFSEKTYMSLASHRIENTTPKPQMMDITVGPTPERLPGSPSHRNDSVGPTPERSSVPPSHRNDNVGPTPERLLDPPSHRNDNVGLVSTRNDNMGATSRRTDINVHPCSERVYMPMISQRKDTAGPVQMPDSSMHPSSQRLYILASQRNDGIGLMPLRMDSTMGPASERMYMPPLSYRSDMAGPPTIEKMYMSAAIQRNDSVPSTSERLYMPANSQRMYAQNPIISMGEYPGQGVSPTLPTSQSL